jgi:ABC-2 type transport system permease protein
VGIAATLTAAPLTPLAFLTAAGTTAVIAVPFILMGLAIGYSMPPKAAVVVAQVLFFPLAFGGGLMTAPGSAPGFVEHLAPYLPTGASVRLMWAAVGDYPVHVGSVLSLIAWIVVLGGVALWAYRRDEGRRYR